MDDYIERLNRIADRYELPKKLNIMYPIAWTLWVFKTLTIGH
jgi:hypothetical protein